jgi:hypothetical protein
MMPSKWLVVPKLTASPTCQKMFSGSARGGAREVRTRQPVAPKLQASTQSDVHSQALLQPLQKRTHYAHDARAPTGIIVLC